MDGSAAWRFTTTPPVWRICPARAFILSSTAAVYGEGDGRLLSEDCRLDPVNVYGRTKAMAEAAVMDIAAAAGLGVGILRYFNAAGADPFVRSGQASQHPHHLIELATHVATGDRRMLSIFGTDYPTPDGTAIRDYVHVSDIADAHVLVMDATLKQGGSRIYNMGTGEGSSVRTVIDALSAVCGHEVPVTQAGRRAGDPAVLVADSRRLRNDLGWRPRYGLTDMLRHALLWEQARRRMPPRQPHREPSGRCASEV